MTIKNKLRFSFLALLAIALMTISFLYIAVNDIEQFTVIKLKNSTKEVNLSFEVLRQTRQLDKQMSEIILSLMGANHQHTTSNDVLKEELKALAMLFRKYPHVHIMCDDIYEHITFDGFQFKTLATIAPDLTR